MGVEETISKLTSKSVIIEMLEKIDNDITYVFNTVRKKVEGLNRNVPYLIIKTQNQMALLYWRSKLNQKMGKRVNTTILEQCIVQLDFEESEYSIEEIENKYKEAQSKQRAVVENGKKLREEELLDKNIVVIEGEDKKA